MSTALMALLASTLLTAQAALVALAPTLSATKPMQIGDVVLLILLLSVPAATLVLALPMALRTSASRSHLVGMLLLGAVFRTMWLGQPAPLEDDFYRYLWDGAIVAKGGNPYAAAPIDLALVDPGGVRSVIRSHINFPDMVTIYPLGAQMAFAVAHLLMPYDLDGLRLVFFFGDGLGVALLINLLRRLDCDPLLAAAYWLNPLVVFTGVATAHVDILLAPLLLGSVAAAVASRPTLAAALLGVSTGVKIWPALLFPVLMRDAYNENKLTRPLVVFSAVAGLCIIPVLLTTAAPASGLAAYADRWINNNGPFAWVNYAIYAVCGACPNAQRGLRIAVGSAALFFAIAVAARPSAGIRDLVARSATVATAVFYLSPAQFPWYALWFLPLAAAATSRPLLTASATLPAYYLFFPLWESGRGTVFLYGAAFLHSVPVWALLVAQRCRRPSSIHASDRGP